MPPVHNQGRDQSPSPQPYRTLPELKSALLRWCAYQERSQADVRTHLRTLGAPADWAEELLTWLIAEKFISDTRFAESYTRGHLGKHWGRLKITEGLRQHGIPDNLIARVLAEQIDEATYSHTLDKLIAQKKATVADKNPTRRAYKIAQFLQGKGYTLQEAKDALQRLGLLG